MNIASIINPISRRPLLALPVILLGTLGLLYFLPLLMIGFAIDTP